MDYRLPNGTILSGLREGYSAEDIKTIAINGGYATEADFQANLKTGADWATTLGELGGGVSGALAGAALGSTVPVVGTVIGGVLGGALGTFGGSLVGQSVESAIEGRQLDSGQQLRNAAEAAAADAAFGLGFGVAGKVVKAIASPLIRLASSTTQEAANVDRLLSLQQKLSQYGTTLLPSQIGSSDLIERATETYAASSVAFRPEYDRIVQGFDKYIQDASLNILNKLPSASREDIGKAITQFSGDVEKAVDDAVAPIYKDIDLRGGLVLRSDEFMSRMQSFINQISAGGVGRTSDKAQTILNMVSKLPPTMTPAEMAANMPQILRTARKAAEGDAQAAGLYNILNNYVEQVRSSPALVDTGAISSVARGEGMRRVSEEGRQRLGGSYGEAVGYISNLRRKMSFSEAREELSFLKSKLRDMENPASPDSAAARVYSTAISNMEKAMESAAKNFDSELYGTYRYVSDFYKRSQETVFSPFMRQALQNNEPAKVGELLARTGYVTPVRELDNLLKLADELGVQSGKDLRGSLTRSYLENIFKTTDAAALNSFNKDMLNPKFRDTFMAVVPKDTANTLIELAQEADILARHTTGGAAASLSVASREIGALESPGKLRSILYGLLPSVVRNKLSNEAITGKLNAMKVLNQQLAQGKPATPSTLSYIIEGLPRAATAAGFAVGTVLTPQ